jgi:hypothetical protein
MLCCIIGPLIISVISSRIPFFRQITKSRAEKERLVQEEVLQWRLT